MKRVGQGRERTGEELGAQVDRELLPLDGPAGDLLDEHRAEGAGRVDGRAGGRGHGDDRGEDDQADGDTGEPGCRLAVDHAEDREHEDERADELRGERLDPADAGVRRHAETHVAGLVAEHPDDGGRADDRTDHLRGDVTGDLRPGELAGDGEPDRDGRVDVVAADVPEGVDGGDHDRAEGQRDHAEIGHRERCVAVDDQGGGHGPDTDEHQERGPDGLCGELLCCGGLVEHLLSFRARISNVIRYSRTLRGRYYHDSLMHKTLRHTLSADVNFWEAER